MHTHVLVYVHVFLARQDSSYLLCMQFELELVSVELILESESTQKSDGIPILAVNLSAKIRASEWTGQVTAWERGKGMR